MLATLALAFVTFSAHAATYYVSTNGNDTSVGTSWATAKQSIQAAIDIAPDGSEIVVTNGVYTSIITDNKAITIRSVEGTEKTIIDGDGINRCATLGSSDLHTNTILTGFTLRNGGHINGGGSFGGTLNHCTLTNNTSPWFGGGAYYGTLNNCILSENTAVQGGGSTFSTLNNCTLVDNKADYGGGAFYGTLNHCTLSGNTAIQGGGSHNSMLNNCLLAKNAAGNFGGGACVGTLNNCTLMNNTATYGGGANNCTLNNCTLMNNTATCGGGAHNCTLNNSTLVGNTGVNSGGGANNNCILNNCTLMGNKAGLGGGAYNSTLDNCILLGNIADAGGGARYGTLNNCTLMGNTAIQGGGADYCFSLNNCIVWGNTVLDGTSSNYNSCTFIRYSCTAPFPGGTGNIAQDPLFMDVANGNFRLKANSPCINAGANEYVVVGDTDLDGKPRILNGRVDIGVYEFGETLPQTPNVPVSIPFEWLYPYRGWQGIMGLEDLALSTGANGYLFWESYVAGLVPTDAGSKFRITTFAVKNDNGKDAVSAFDWSPRRTDRNYTVLGKTNLTDQSWHSPTNSGTRFFKVKVEL